MINLSYFLHCRVLVTQDVIVCDVIQNKFVSIAPAKIRVPPQNTWVEEGQRARLRCLASGDETITYTWYKDGTMLLLTSHLTFNKGELIYFQTIKADEGMFHCRVQNQHGSDISKRAMLFVYSK